MKTRMFIFMLLAFNPEIYCQITFEKTYGGFLTDEGFSVQQTSDEGYIAAGSTYSFGGGPNVFLVRTNPYGDLLWLETSIAGTAHDIIIDEDGGFVLCGTLFTTSDDLMLVKTNNVGDVVWSKTFGGNAGDYGYSLQKTLDGGFIVCGSTESTGAQFRNIYLVKTDPDGILQWEKTYSGLAISEGYKVRQTTDETYVVSGYTSMITDKGGVIDPSFLLKVDVLGDSVWMKTYPGEGADSFTITPENGFLVCSTVGNIPMGEQDILLIETDSTGDAIWQKTLQLSTPFNKGYWIEKTNDTEYVLAGFAGSYSPVYDINALLVKINLAGDTLWTRIYGGDQPDAMYCVRQTVDEAYILCGSTASMGYGLKDLYLIKTDDQGVVTSVMSKENDFPIRVYPNPVSDFLQVDIQNSRVEYQLSLCDMHGNQRILSTLPAGRQQISLDVSDLPSGVYLMEVKQNNLCVGAKKVVVE